MLCPETAGKWGWLWDCEKYLASCSLALSVAVPALLHAGGARLGRCLCAGKGMAIAACCSTVFCAVPVRKADDLGGCQSFLRGQPLDQLTLDADPGTHGRGAFRDWHSAFQPAQRPEHTQPEWAGAIAGTRPGRVAVFAVTAEGAPAAGPRLGSINACFSTAAHVLLRCRVRALDGVAESRAGCRQFPPLVMAGSCLCRCFYGAGRRKGWDLRQRPALQLALAVHLKAWCISWWMWAGP